MLKDALETYLTIRRSAGFGLEESERMLGLFVAFATDRGDTHVRAATAIDWAKSARTLGVRHQRLQCVALFAQHLRAEDPRHESPRKDLFHLPPRELRPYIYSPEEARQLVAAAGQLGPVGSLRPHTFAALFALLFSTGMRISEALALRFVDVADGGLYIVGTKFRKRRFVPLHETAQAGLRRYLELRRARASTTDHVFINIHGEPLGYKAVSPAFHKSLEVAGVSRPPGEPRPRIHDARHTFAVRALETSPDGRDRIGQHMRALSTYLGHSNVADTYWYLQATPRLMHDIADACENQLAKGGAR